MREDEPLTPPAPSPQLIVLIASFYLASKVQRIKTISWGEGEPVFQGAEQRIKQLIVLLAAIDGCGFEVEGL